MRFKVIIAMVEQEHQEAVISSAKDAGATGVTILNARGEGIREQKTFFGLQMEQQREVLLFIVEDFHANSIMDAIYKAGNFKKGAVWHFHGQLTGSSAQKARWRLLKKQLRKNIFNTL